MLWLWSEWYCNWDKIQIEKIKISEIKLNKVPTKIRVGSVLDLINDLIEVVESLYVGLIFNGEPVAIMSWLHSIIFDHVQENILGRVDVDEHFEFWDVDSVFLAWLVLHGWMLSSNNKYKSY